MPAAHTEILESDSPAATAALAERVLARLPGRAVLALHGELGSGKTCFVQGLAAAMGLRAMVTSPTFTLVHEHCGGARPLVHIDLYRIRDASDALQLGFEDYLAGEGVCAVEWPERAEALFPPDTVHLLFEVLTEPDRRRITIQWPAGRAFARPAGCLD